MNSPMIPIFAGKGVTAAIRHNSATKQRGQHNDLLFHEEHMIGAFDRWQMIKSAQLIMSKTSVLIPIGIVLVVLVAYLIGVI